MVPSRLCFILETHLEPIGLTCNGHASWEVMVVYRLLCRVNVHSSHIAHSEWSCCGLSMALRYANGSLLTDVDVRAIAIMIRTLVNSFTLLVSI